jgi:hypothetical protein
MASLNRRVNDVAELNLRNEPVGHWQRNWLGDSSQIEKRLLRTQMP